MKYLLSTLLTTFILINVTAQSSIDNILDSIAENNKTIKANEQYWESKKLEYKTGLNLYNPTIEYDYLLGNPTGTQTEFEASQSFDFPTVYIKRNQLSGIMINKTEFEQKAFNQNILIEAKLTCLELIYRNKLHSELKKRLQNSEKLYNDFQKKMSAGDANIIDVNKAKLQLLNLQTEFRVNENLINELTDHLTEMNGGDSVLLSDTIYPLVTDIPNFKTLGKTYEDNDPNLILINKNKEASMKQVAVSRALSMPKFEAGYRSQTGMGQKFNGVHFGITIPLWENKNTVKFTKAQVLHNEIQADQHLSEHYFEIKHLYERYENLKISFDEYKQILGSLNSINLLGNALKLGHISSIEYFMELTYYYETYNNYLQIEKDYYQTIAKLYKFEL